MFNDCLIKYLTVLLECPDLFANYVEGHSKHLGGPGPRQAYLLATPMFYY